MVFRFFFASVFLVLPLHSSLADDVADLAKGKTIIRLEEIVGSKHKKGITKAVIDAPLDRVWSVITDYEHYAEFMPKTVKSEVRSKTKDEVRYFAELNMPWPIADVSYECLVKYVAPPSHIDFELVPRTGKGMKMFSGHWDFSKYEGAENRTLAEYSLVFESDRWYPNWAVNMGTKQTIGEIINALRQRLKKTEDKTQK